MAAALHKVCKYEKVKTEIFTEQFYLDGTMHILYQMWDDFHAGTHK